MARIFNMKNTIKITMGVVLIVLYKARHEALNIKRKGES